MPTYWGGARDGSGRGEIPAYRDRGEGTAEESSGVGALSGGIPAGNDRCWRMREFDVLVEGARMDMGMSAMLPLEVEKWDKAMAEVLETGEIGPG